VVKKTTYCVAAGGAERIIILKDKWATSSIVRDLFITAMNHHVILRIFQQVRFCKLIIFMGLLTAPTPKIHSLLLGDLLI